MSYDTHAVSPQRHRGRRGLHIASLRSLPLRCFVFVTYMTSYLAFRLLLRPRLLG